MVRSLVQEVLTNNNSDAASDERYVTINATNPGVTGLTPKGTAALISLSAGGTNDQPKYGANFSNTKTYNVDFQYNGSRIAIIDIK